MAYEFEISNMQASSIGAVDKAAKDLLSELCRLDSQESTYDEQCTRVILPLTMGRH